MASFSGSASSSSRKEVDEGTSRDHESDVEKGQPPSYQDSVDAAAQQECLSHLTESQRRTAQRVNERASHHASAEADRLRRFLHYCMSVDYQQDYTASLNAADRAHYATLHTMLIDLESTSDIPASTGERALLAPYFWHVLHQPCTRLGVPVELVMTYVKRFFVHQGRYANYKGSIWDIPLREDMDALAEKLL